MTTSWARYQKLLYEILPCHVCRPQAAEPSLREVLVFSKTTSPHVLLIFAESLLMQSYKNQKGMWKPEVVAGRLHNKTVFLHCSALLAVLARSVRWVHLIFIREEGEMSALLCQLGNVFLCSITVWQRISLGNWKGIAVFCCRMGRFKLSTYLIQLWCHLFCIRAY